MKKVLAMVVLFEFVLGVGFAQIYANTFVPFDSSFAVVSKVQTALNKSGYNVPTHGAMDKPTIDGLKRFQKDHQLKATGIPDQQTLRALHLPTSSLAHLKQLGGVPDSHFQNGSHITYPPPTSVQQIQKHQPTLLGVSLDGRGIYGLDQADTTTDAVKNVYPVKVGKKWGFVDQHGKTVLPATLNDFDGRQALLNQDGKSFVLGAPLQIHSSEPLQKNPKNDYTGGKIAWYQNQGINGGLVQGAPVLNRAKFDRVGTFRGGLAPALRNHRIYYIHPDGTIAFGGFKVAGTDLERESFVMTDRLQKQIHLGMRHDPPVIYPRENSGR